MKEKTDFQKVTDDSAVQKPVTEKAAAKKRAATGRAASRAKKAMQEYGAGSKQANEAVEAFGKASAAADTATKRVRKPVVKKPAPKRRAVRADGSEVGSDVPAVTLPERPLATVIGTGPVNTAEAVRLVRALDDEPARAPEGSEAETLERERRVRALKNLLSGNSDMPYNASDKHRPHGSLNNRHIACMNSASQMRDARRFVAAQRRVILGS